MVVVAITFAMAILLWVESPPTQLLILAAQERMTAKYLMKYIVITLNLWCFAAGKIIFWFFYKASIGKVVNLYLQVTSFCLITCLVFGA